MTDREVMQMALDALEEFCEHGAILRPIERREALRTALAQPEPEPVAWWNPIKDSVSTDPYYRKNKDCIPLYTAPPKKEWVGLPNDEVLERANKFRDPETYLRGVLWAEAKLKEKNT